MKKKLIVDRCDFTDIVPLYAGYERKSGEQISASAKVRNYYAIYFLNAGSGDFIDKFGRHKVHSGELVVIRPDDTTTFIADNGIIEYIYVSFRGTAVKVFDTNRSVYTYPQKSASALRDLIDKIERAPSAYISVLFDLIYNLFATHSQLDTPADVILQYIEFNYMNNITITSLSNLFGFERSYLYRIFKTKTGLSIKDYLTQTRMKSAKQLLQKGYSVAKAAYSVGYKNEFNFSRAFKEYFGKPPKEFKSPN